MRDLRSNSGPEPFVSPAGFLVRLDVVLNTPIHEYHQIDYLDQAGRFRWGKVQGIHNLGKLTLSVAPRAGLTVHGEIGAVLGLFTDLVGDYERVPAEFLAYSSIRSSR